ncbi:hypothetical protein JKA74_01485 [Marivirga sp. S37H4]|uniref:Uncharacterized protein n=1 Tax=Marivirga aurantiaca TaxID=2802615 RepID=A0A934WVH1_9BACT|nr:hypothetical protein [Marivirga aurantiaca]MBK6263691.1 hypothetical protein [Marivirga aurantiaca]
MKKALLFLSIIFISLELNGQTGEYYDPDHRPQFYLGIGTGINTYTGLAGISANYILDKRLFLQGGLGLSTWGIRTSIGLRYDRSYRHGVTYGVNLTRSSGIDDIDVEFDSGNGSPNTVNMRLESVSTLNFKVGYNWWFGKYNTFNLTLGYALALKDQPWEVKDGSTLSQIDQQVLQILSPGGIILGMGLSFGIQ